MRSARATSSPRFEAHAFSGEALAAHQRRLHGPRDRPRRWFDSGTTAIQHEFNELRTGSGVVNMRPFGYYSMATSTLSARHRDRQGTALPGARRSRATSRETLPAQTIGSPSRRRREVCSPCRGRSSPRWLACCGNLAPDFGAILKVAPVEAASRRPVHRSRPLVEGEPALSRARGLA